MSMGVSSEERVASVTVAARRGARLDGLPPDQASATTLAWKQRNALVCVRHRIDAGGRTRYTKGELLIERAKPRSDRFMGVNIDDNERPLQGVGRAARARWDPRLKLWRTQRCVARPHRLYDRIVGQ